MPRLRILAITVLSVLALVIVASPTACSSKSCTPGQSVACTGPGGCAGGQVCNADGTGYEACACGATDSGTPNDGSAGDGGSDAALPTHGALHVTWKITSGGNPTTCAAVSGVTVDVLLTSNADGGLTDKTFPCNDGSGDVTGLAFDTYVVSISLLDNASLALSTAPNQNVTLGPTGCDSIIAGDCAKNLSPTFAF